MTDNEKKALELCQAIKILGSNTETLENFNLYLNKHIEKWFSRYCSDIDGIISELKRFANME